ncbi:hypothetical protein PILCRDRAFT_823315 [Piloderma croceum F 1598]|uniref:Uncharacterized protein n=1 Tax=Piloderma croceum (strain F 1598) TaxID=765440 RepID=A0A0C3FJT8_PILCF|nr:hypothetical protein PILCRDRAFT_823315 [Piloderma croceum F 1598]
MRGRLFLTFKTSAEAADEPDYPRKLIQILVAGTCIQRKSILARLIRTPTMRHTAFGRHLTRDA